MSIRIVPLHRFAFVAPLLAALASLACDSADSGTPPPPANYTQSIVFIADGTWDPADPNHPALSMETLQRETWGFDDAAIAQFDADTKAFFAARFGIDVDDPALADRISVSDYVVDDRAGYRVIAMSGRNVPAEGWPVSDGSRVLAVIDPAGLELGGELAGVVAPVGASFTVGRYVIETDTGESIPIDFKPFNFFAFNSVGIATAHCELSSAFGSGEAFVSIHQTQAANGEITLDLRNVLLFE